MPLAERKNDITGICKSETFADGFAAVRFNEECLIQYSAFVDSLIRHFFEDLVQRFGAGIFGRQYGDIGTAGGNIRHHAPFFPVTQTRGSVNRNDASLRISVKIDREHLAGGCERFFQCVWGMSEVHDGDEILSFVDHLHTARDTDHIGNTEGSCFRTDAKTVNSRGHGSQEVRPVIVAEQAGPDFGFLRTSGKIGESCSGFDPCRRGVDFTDRGRSVICLSIGGIGDFPDTYEIIKEIIRIRIIIV